MELLAATTNLHKLDEFRSILGPLNISVASAYDRFTIPEIEETGTTFEENAVIKACEAASITNSTVFAEDSGLEVFSLNSDPGIYSARYAGSEATDQENLDKLMQRLGVSEDRAARYVCVLALATPEKLVGVAEGEVRGRIGLSQLGTNGFGYDPVFIPDGHVTTFGQMQRCDKDTISHRANALKNAIDCGLFNLEKSLT